MGKNRDGEECVCVCGRRINDELKEDRKYFKRFSESFIPINNSKSF